MKVWVVQNKLQLNDNKTGILLSGSAHGIDLPSSLRVGPSDISFSSAANLDVFFDSELALKEQVNKLCQLAYLEIKRIGSIRQFPSVEASKTLLFSLGLIIAMLSLLALLRFSWIKSTVCLLYTSDAADDC